MATVPTKSITDITKAKPLTPEFRKPTVSTAAFGGAVAQQEALAARSAGESAHLIGEAVAGEARAYSRIGEAVAGAGKKLFEVVIEKQKQDTDREVNNALIEFRRKQLEIVWGSADNNWDGPMTQKGDKAIAAMRVAQNEIEMLRAESIANLSSGRAQQMFKIASAVSLFQNYKAMGAKVIAEREYAREMGAKARIASELANVRNAGGDDPRSLEGAAAIIRAQANTLFSGLPPDAREKLVQIELGKMWVAAVQGQIARGKDLLALALVNREGPWKNRPKTVVEASLREFVKKNSRLNKVERSAELISAMVDDNTGELLSNLEQINMAREIHKGDAETSKAVVEALELRHAQKKRDTKIQQNKDIRFIWRLIEEGKSRTWIWKNHPARLENAIAGGLNLKDIYTREIQKAAGENFAAVDNVVFLDKVLGMKEEERVNVPIAELRSKLTEKTFYKVLGLVRQAEQKLTQQMRQAQKTNLDWIASRVKEISWRWEETGRKWEKVRVLSPAQQELLQGYMANWMADYAKENKGQHPEIEKVKSEFRREVMYLLSEQRWLLGVYPTGVQYVPKLKDRFPIVWQRLTSIVLLSGGKPSEELLGKLAAAYGHLDGKRFDRLIEESKEKPSNKKDDEKNDKKEVDSLGTIL